jgi:hypothetical protein
MNFSQTVVGVGFKGVIIVRIKKQLSTNNPEYISNFFDLFLLIFWDG